MYPNEKFAAILIQASSRTWAGGPDPSMNPVDNCETSLQYVVEKAKRCFHAIIIRIIAPKFDDGGYIDTVVRKYLPDKKFIIAVMKVH
jgi:hypothetical protein